MKSVAWFTLLPLLLLILLFMSWPDFPFSNANWIHRGLIALPLFLLLPALVTGSRIAPGLAGFASIIFLAHGVTEVIANPALRVAAALEIFLALMIFIGVATDLRKRRLIRNAAIPGE